MADQASRDQNFVPSLLAVSSIDGLSTVKLYADPTSHRLLVDLPNSSGTVTSVSVVSANGLAGSVATATTTPAITLSTTVNSPVLAGNGTAIAAATTTGTGSTVVLNNGPTLIAPALGAATATSINGNIFTPGSSTYTGTAGQTYTFPAASATVAGIASTQTLTNKRVTRRLVATTQSATPTINTDNTDISNITGLAQAITSFTTNLTGTPVDGDLLEIRITDNGTARALTFGTSFEATTVALPTTTVISTMLRILFEWNAAASKWDCLAVA